MMEKAPLSEFFTISMTRQEKVLLEKLAYEQGATMRGYLRKLIRDAAASKANSDGAGTRYANAER